MSSPTAEHVYRPPMLDGEALHRRLGELARWRRHSAFIRALRAALPLAIGLLMLVLTGWAVVNTLGLRNNAARPSGMAIRMVNPKFFGRDGAGRPFVLSAASAVRDNSQFQLIYLDQPAVVLGAQPTNQTRVNAKKGVYREDTRILVLDGDVHLRDSQGYDFISPHAVVDTLTNDVDGQAHVDGQGPFGRISSSAYSARHNGAEIYFTGRVSAHIVQHSTPAPATDNLRGPR